MSGVQEGREARAPTMTQTHNSVNCARATEPVPHIAQDEKKKKKASKNVRAMQKLHSEQLKTIALASLSPSHSNCAFTMNIPSLSIH